MEAPSGHMRALMDRPDNVRNMSVVGPLGHGKSALVDALVSRAGVAHAGAGGTRFTDTRDDEKARGITIKSTAVSVPFRLGSGGGDALHRRDTEDHEYLLNLVDSPGHANFSAEVSAALRITDGALVVVDCADAVRAHTETVLQQALAERVRPVLFINKLDRVLHLPKEDLFQAFSRTVDAVNLVLADCCFDPALRDVRVSPEMGNVAFGAGLHGWGFTLRQFASRYSKKFGVDPEKMMDKLWGDNFFDPATKRWTRKSTNDEGQPLERGFNMYVLDPITKLFHAIMDPLEEHPEPIWERLGIQLSAEERDFEGEKMFIAVMRKFVPVCDSLLEMIVINLPSPRVAQRYRVAALYQGPMHDESAMGMRDCDAQGPLELYVSKMVYTSEEGRFYALGRVFSGTVRAGDKVHIRAPGFIPGEKHDSFVESIERTVLMIGPYVAPIEDCPAGNIVGLVGIDRFLLRNGTVTSSETAHCIRPMKFSVYPVVKTAVEVCDVADLPRLVEGLNRLRKSDPCVEVSLSDVGEHIIAGVDALHLEICLKDLEDYAHIPLKTSHPVIAYRETIQRESSAIALSKSPNKLTRIFMKASPLGEELCNDIESGTINPRGDIKTRAQSLVDGYGWDARVAKKIWCFGPDRVGANILVDATLGLWNLHEIKDSCVAAFQWVTNEGVCSEENMRGARFNIVDVSLVGDVIRRGAGQIIPTCRRVCYAAALLATPGIQEPVYLVEVQCSESVIADIKNFLTRHRGQVLSEERCLGTSIFTIKAYLPAAESFGFTADVKSCTQGQVVHQSLFHHWELMAGTPLEQGSKLEALVSGIRTRKGLQPKIPALETYLDRL